MNVFWKILGLELLLMFFYTANGVYSSVKAPSSPFLQFIGLVPLAVGILLYLLVRKKWSYYFFDGLKNFQLVLISPLVLVLLIILIGNKGLDVSSISHLVSMLIMQILVVGLIEETFFRGFMLRMLMSIGVRKAVVISSFLFGITHALQLMSGQSVEDTILQILYAILVGFVLSLLIVHRQSIMITIAFHGLNNFLNFMGQQEGTKVYAYLIIIVLFIYSIYLWIRIDKKEIRQNRQLVM
ncbi:CPBP family intramembrane glutamic endopeptidase [Bacillus massiliigorillae]|uniref:CPBP family intramembrane glutamic endopeptidase n=1 Tax=Bacillus massiliigorillae TaxID=1243664 RepID=UPI00039C0349|nr:CPBP family intramembrane glutamic endopeptidase [Bacillus massiliigorillae]